ncbi:acyltransferase [Mucilaginibacter sp. RS28]|uniref:Acyltransferase n=1 Tax=Mucilaginibacter straminoryzae TaxID=2932774 RepID=A0A9X1X3F4_9SPHI|nr:acyltransferase [Mucilaginibacter straminoryzae]MCJ8210191.1 acyltransferase [Mucilaginibacter straminoryzae]
MQLKYFKELDGVRGLAALMVVVFHINQATGNNSFIERLIHKPGTIGQTGVILFFVLSGFLITRILIASKERPHYFSNFYIRRSFRIFPLYYLSLLIFLVVVPLISTGQVTNFKDSWTFWVYLQNVAMTFNWPLNGPGHFWSLAVEEHFYLIWPLVVYYCNDRSLLKVIIGIIITSIFFRILFAHLGYGTFYFTFTTMDCLAMGGFAALNYNHKWLSVKKALLIISVLLITLAASWYFLGKTKSDVVSLFKVPLTAFFYMLLILILTEKETFLNRIFNLNFLRYTGKISYGLYIFHPLCIEIAVKYFYTTSFLPTLILIFLASYGIAIASFYLYESRFLRLKDKFSS